MTRCDVTIVGCGFIGSEIANSLKDTYNIHTISRNPQPDWLEKYNIPHKICDVTNYQSLFENLKDSSVVINTAALNITKTSENKEMGYQVNVLGNKNCCQIVAKNPSIGGFILTSSMGVFGWQPRRITEHSSYRPEQSEEYAISYYTTKVIQELTVKYYASLSPTKLFGILRIDTVIGKRRQDNYFVNKFINQALSRNPITVYKHTQNRPFSFISIDDVCKGMMSYVKAIFDKKQGQTDLEKMVNLSYPEPLTAMGIANIVKESIIKHSKGLFIPTIEIVDKGIIDKFGRDNTSKTYIETGLAKQFFKFDQFKHPQTIIDEIIKEKLK